MRCEKMNFRRSKGLAWIFAGLALLSTACLIGRQTATAIPQSQPASFEIRTATPTVLREWLTVEATPAEAEPLGIVPLGDAPTHTPDPNAPPPPLATETLPPTTETTEEAVAAAPVEPTATTAPEPVEVVATVPPTLPLPPADPDPPLEGGDWDFEAEYIPWANPYGEPCPGAAVAGGWDAFVQQGEYGSSCFNENLYQPNVFSGAKSQEITFDFIAANSGVFRSIPTKVGHRYNITAHAKNDRSIAPVQMFLGVDLTGNTLWEAETVQWFPWDNATEDAWGVTEETVTATGERMTIFIRGYHPMADQGGKTVIDNVSVTDLGP